MYAGALFTLGEIPGGAILIGAFDMSKYFPTLADSTIKFIKPATTDIYVELKVPEEELERIGKEAAEKGKSLFLLEMELKNEKGETVAISKGSY